MNNLFSKSLLCGVLATSFLLINCQKAPNRAVKAQVTPTAKPSAKVGDCDANIATNYDLLKKSKVKISDKLKSITGEVGASDIEELNTLVKELNALSKKVMADIKVLKLDACNVHEANDAKKPVTDKADVDSIRQGRSSVGKDVKAKTKVDNEITTEDASAITDTLTGGQELILSADLAAILADDKNSNGAVVIANGKIEKDATAAKAILADKTITACSLVITTKEDVKAEQKIKIMAPLEEAKMDDTTKRNVLKVFVAVSVAADAESAPPAMTLVCNIADTKEKEAAKEIRKALGSLVSDVVKALEEAPAAPPTAVVTPPAAPPAAAVTPPAAPATAAAKAAAVAGLSILDQAEARK